VILYSALTLGIGAATLLVFIRHFERERAERTATLEASVVTQAVVDRLRPADLQGLTHDRKRELDELFETRVLDEQTLAAAIVTDDARPAYSTEGAPAVSRAELQENMAKALAGIVTGDVVSTRIGTESKKVLRTYAPFRLSDGSNGAVVVDKDYAPIASAAREAAIAVAAILELVLVALWLCLIPIMRTVTKRIHRQLDTIAYMALHDELTGLPNRTQLGSRLDDLLAAREGNVRLAVFFIDLDRFKEVNDTLGHDRGNDLLVEISKRLDAALGRGELVARLGGDEFAVISERAVDAESALVLAERLRSVIADLFEIAGISIEPQASIGIALAPEHGATRDDLLRRADIAMYAAKRTGVPQVFVSELDDHSPVRLAMSGELRRALEGGELVVYYQPQYDLVRGKVRGAEALVRWAHPTRGILEPKAFLSAVEHTGLMRQLTGLVLEESLRQLRSWHDLGLDLTLAVNVSSQDLADARFPQELDRALAKHRIDPSALELEITENVLLTDSVRTATRLKNIVGRGIRIAIDDFGVGYSSLGHLKDLPARVLKIDQSFVSGMITDPRDAAIVRSTIELAHRLGLEVVAEGVETRELMTQLRDAGCDIVQGYYLGRPLPFGRDSDWKVLTAQVDVPPIRTDTQVVPLRRVG
jgi:diguanylate cyclase (GGDEF)-like protein